MFNLSFGEIAFIMIVALVVLGPERLPSVARFLGRSLGELRRTVDAFKADLNSSLSEIEPPKLTTTMPPAADTPPPAEPSKKPSTEH